MSLETYTDGDLVLAIVIRRNYRADGISFFTPNDYSQQLAYMSRAAGYEIEPHVHNEVSRNVKLTQEVLLVRSGRVRVDLYSRSKVYLRSVEVAEGDVILLADGGHGFTMLEDSEMIEVKQGPYSGDQDKVRFTPEISKEAQPHE
jgi:mannose-6-phosphate isomerase-like protein (cupin superfamily)